jgi:hypothetical protein
MIMMGDRKRMITAVLGPHESKEAEKEEINAKEEIMHELIESFHAHDIQGALSAFKALFLECESEPHEENEIE